MSKDSHQAYWDEQAMQATQAEQCPEYVEPPAYMSPEERRTGSLDRTSKDVRVYEGGSFRDRPAGKGLFSPMPMNALLRVAKRYEFGALKYGKSEAYKDGLPVKDCFDSAMRHLVQYLNGDNTEDHLAAAVWNCMAMMYMEEENPKWQDVPSRKGLTKENGDFDYIQKALKEGFK